MVGAWADSSVHCVPPVPLYLDVMGMTVIPAQCSGRPGPLLCDVAFMREDPSVECLAEAVAGVLLLPQSRQGHSYGGFAIILLRLSGLRVAEQDNDICSA